MGKLDVAMTAAASGMGVDVTEMKNLTEAVKVLDVSVGKLNSNFETLTQKSTKVYKTVDKTIQPLREQTKALNDMAAQSNRFNAGNITAQLQDIGVTAAMKMNPLTIALQQGTQLVYVLQQSKAPLKDFVAGIKSLFTPLSLAVVGITGLVAAGIQMVNWVNVGKKVLNSIGDAFDWVAKNAKTFVVAITAATTVLIAFNAKSIVLTISNLVILGATAVATGVKIAAAWVVASGPIGWILTAIVGITTAVLTLGDKIENIFGKKFITVAGKILDVFKEIANKTIGVFAAAFNSIVQGAKWVWEKLKSMVGGEGPAKSLTDTLIESNMKLINKDYVGDAIDGVKKAASAVGDKFREWSKHIGETKKDVKKLQKEIEKISKSYEGIFTKKADELEKLQFEDSLEGLDVYEKTYRSIIHDMTKEVDDLRKSAIEAGVPLSKINQMFASAPSRIEAAARAEAEYKAAIEKTRAETELYNSVIDYGASITKGFFDDMKSGLKQGESVWESFTNAVLNMLDKIQDKMMDLAIDAAFESLKSGNTGSNSWLGSVVKAGMSLFGATSGNSTAGAFNAMGGQMGVKPTLRASDGGAFSNGVYSSPTVFKFAKGDKFGVMGEAGPEAVMPLKRTPDGSLGVKADGMNSSPVVVNVINNSNAQARTERRQTDQGVEIDVLIDEMIGKKLNTDGTASNTALKAYNNRQLIMR